MVTVTIKKNKHNLLDYLNRVIKKDYTSTLKKYGDLGVAALASATPKDSGLTAASWRYEIEDSDSKVGIYWTNDNINENINIAVILDKGHGTGTGGYVQGRHYISPAIHSVFDEIANVVFEEVTKA